MRHRYTPFCGASRNMRHRYSRDGLITGLPPALPSLSSPNSLFRRPRSPAPPLAAGSPPPALDDLPSHLARRPGHHRPATPPPASAPSARARARGAPDGTRPCSRTTCTATRTGAAHHAPVPLHHPLSLLSTIPSPRYCSFPPLSLPSTPAHKVFGQMPNPVFLQNFYDLLLIACCK